MITQNRDELNVVTGRLEELIQQFSVLLAEAQPDAEADEVIRAVEAQRRNLDERRGLLERYCILANKIYGKGSLVLAELERVAAEKEPS
jgi:hypothetical protein